MSDGTQVDYDRIEELGDEIVKLMLKFKSEVGKDVGPYGVVGQAIWRTNDVIKYWKKGMPRPHD